MAELAFEYLLMALEASRGTAVDPPTHYLNMAGTVTPRQARYRPDESRGSLVAHYRSKTVRRWCELSAEGPLDNAVLPLLACMALDGSVSATTPGGGTNSRDWTFVPTITSDDVDAATVYWGDPNIQAFKAAYVMLDELRIRAGTDSTDGAMMSISGQGQFPSKDAPDSLPTQITGPLFVPGEMQLWIDTGSDAIGTTAVTGRFIATEITIPTGVTRKWHAAGAGATLNFTGIGRAKRAATLSLTLELPDMTQYDLFAGSSGDTTAKVRVRFNGPIIEGSLRHQVTFDIYGPLELDSWGEHAGTNRTIVLNVISEYDSTLGADFQLVVRNDRASL